MTEKRQNNARLRHDRAGPVGLHRRAVDRIWDVAGELFGVVDVGGHFLSANPAWPRALGWTERELGAMHVNELQHPDDSEDSVIARMRRLVEKQPFRVTNRFRHKDGTWRWISWELVLNEGVVYLFGRDVTAERGTMETLRESERQFRVMVAGVTDYALFMLDPRGIVSSWNAGAQRIKGYQREEILGRHFSRFYTEQARAAGTPQRALAIAAQTGTYEEEGWRVRKDGSLFWASVVIDALRDETGALIGFAKITRDITERRDAQLALRRTQEQLAQSQKLDALGQLTGGIAHDFNNLLMVVSGRAQALRRHLNNERDLRSLEAIEMAAERGENLTRQLLAFSRRQSFNRSLIRLDERIAAFRDVLQSSTRGDIRLEIAIDPATWPVVVDPGELELALVNLTLNARDAMPNGGTIRIATVNRRLEAERTPEGLDGDFVVLTVADTGLGIEPAVLPKVFEPFFTTKEIGKGSGLGLSQVYGFARQSGGTASISSTPGVGTAVTLYLPRSDKFVGEAKRPPSSLETSRGHETILVVEDNVEVGAVTTALLEQLGYRVRQVETAADALDALASGERIDLVFSDVVMPGEMSGLGLAVRLKQDFPRIPVILTSGYVKALNEAEQEFPILRKPFKIATLGQAVRQALDRGRVLGRA